MLIPPQSKWVWSETSFFSLRSSSGSDKEVDKGEENGVAKQQSETPPPTADTEAVKDIFGEEVDVSS